MTSCAIAPCEESRERGGAGCRLCDVVAKIRIVRCVGRTQDEQKPCGLVSGHAGACKASRGGKPEAAELKEAEPLPDLSAPRAPAIALGRMKRHRVGPHR